MNEKNLIAQARAATPAADKTLPPEATEKKAKLSLSLRADSGYMADETHRISAQQWGRICKIVNEKD